MSETLTLTRGLMLIASFSIVNIVGGRVQNTITRVDTPLFFFKFYHTHDLKPTNIRIPIIIICLYTK